MWKVCWSKGRLYWKIAKLFHFCHLSKLARPETYGPYHVSLCIIYSDRCPIPHSWTKWVEASGLYFLVLFLSCTSFTTSLSVKTFMNILVQWLLFCACSNQQTFATVSFTIWPPAHLSMRITQVDCIHFQCVQEIVTWICPCIMWAELGTSRQVTFMFCKQRLQLHT